MRDAGAVRAASAEIGQAVAGGLFQAIHGAGEHESQCVFTRSARTRKNDGVRKAAARQHLAQAMDGFRVASEIGKWHKKDFAIW